MPLTANVFRICPVCSVLRGVVDGSFCKEFLN